VLDGFPRGLQEETLLGVDRDRFALADVEEVGVESGDVVDERAPLGDGPSWHTGLWVEVLLGVPAIQRNRRHRVDAAQQRIPQTRWRVDAAGKSAPHADHGDW